MRTRRQSGKQRGQSFVESTVVLLIFFTLLFAVIDVGQILVTHQAMVERVRTAVRWGVIQWGTVRANSSVANEAEAEQNIRQGVTNMILYGQPEAPRVADPGYLGLESSNIQVRLKPASNDPAVNDDALLSVGIVNYPYHFITPGVARQLINPRPILISAPLAF
jgi:Flp pilus assembly protein TadG